MSLAKFILSQNVRRVRVCLRLAFSARNRKAPERMDVLLLGRVVVVDVSGKFVRMLDGDGFHFAGLLWILKPISQMTPQSSRATVTLILL